MREIKTSHAPSYDLPLSQGIEHNGIVYASGQVPVDPNSGEIIDGSLQSQTRRTLDNINRILEEANSSLGNALKVTIFVTDIENFNEINEVYREYVSEPFPARSVVEVADLAIDVPLEVEALAAVGD